MRAIEPVKNLLSFSVFLFLIGNPDTAKAQEILDEPPAIIEQQLEDLTEANEDIETEDDGYLQQMQHFLKEPVNLNVADANLLQELKLLNAVQINNLLSYRKLFGNFLSIYELQAIPGWNLDVIRRISPFVIVAEKAAVFHSLNKRFKNGNSTLLFRASQTIEKSKGYLLDRNTGNNFYPGSRQKLLLRYKYKSGNLLQYGFTAEKDAGEQFFKGTQKNGFDFYSAHLFIRKLGIIKCLAIGDFSVNMGQGLTQWQSLAFGKGAEITNTKRQSEILTPYNSAGEIVYHRGAGITLQRKNMEATGFVSYRKMDAGFETDSENKIHHVTSLHTSGYHRTANEIAGKGIEGQLTYGGNFSFSNEKFHLGTNAVHYDFEHQIIKADYLYNRYSLSGKHMGNYSLDYSFTYQNMHFFGEAATDGDWDKAFVNGLLINADANIAMTLLYRNISRGYQSLYSNAFTENTNPTNESGFYSGITITPTSFIRLDAYADFYHFPWLKYRVDAPTSGNDYMLQFTYQPNKQFQLRSRFRYQKKPINFNTDESYLNPVVGRPKKSLRTEFDYKIDNRFSLRSRVELLVFDEKNEFRQNGYLAFIQLNYKPPSKYFSANTRLSYFETDGYDSRIYAFENDVLYGYSIPVFFDKGYRYYINIHYKISGKLSLWSRFAQTIYTDKTSIGSGLDAIKGNKKSEIKVQMIYSF
ncbi:MAG: ComEA family DNA-binding protein [Ginsengibacter sp.]